MASKKTTYEAPTPAEDRKKALATALHQIEKMLQKICIMSHFLKVLRVNAFFIAGSGHFRPLVFPWSLHTKTTHLSACISRRSALSVLK